MSPAFLTFLLCSITGAFAQTLVGPLPTHAHVLAGNLYIIDSDTLLITDFEYDGNGPDAFPYYYTPPFADGRSVAQLEIGGGIIIGTQFAVRVSFDGTTNYTLELPPFVRACDIGTFGVWCRYAQQLFTSIEIPADLFTTDQSDTSKIFCEPSPGVYIGDISASDNTAISGTLYIVDDKTAVVDGFTFDATQQGEPVFVFYFPAGVMPNPTGDGGVAIVLSAPTGALPNMAYSGASLTLPFGDGFSCDVAGSTLLFGTASGVLLAYVAVPLENTVAPVVEPYPVFTNNPAVQTYYGGSILCDRPATRPGVYVGQLSALDQLAFDDHAFTTDTAVYAVDNDTLFFQLFTYDGSGVETYFRYWVPDSTVQNDGDGGTNLYVDENQAQFGTGRSESFSFANVELNLRDTPDVDANLCDIGTLTIWGREPPEEDGGEPGEPRVFAQIEIPASIFTDDYATAVANDNLIFCVADAPSTVATDGAPSTVAMVTLVTMLAFVLSALLFQA